jgi:hypothetical protein
MSQLRFHRGAVCGPADTFVQQSQRFIESSRLAFQHGEEKQRISMAWIERQHFLVHGSSGGGATAAMVLCRDLHHSGQ